MKWLFYLLVAFSSPKVLAQCKDTHRPIVFVHGFLASGDTWSNAVRFFGNAGYCKERLYVFDWNTLAGNGKQNEILLAQFIQRVLITTGAEKIDLVGHSAGGGLSRSFLKDSILSKQVAHYIHIGSRKWTESYPWFTNQRCLNIFSSGDRVAGSGAGIVEGAENLALTEEDHYQVATSNTPLEAMLRFLNDGTDHPFALKENTVQIGGKAVLLGDNQPMAGATISLYPISKKNGTRVQSVSIQTAQVNEKGVWGPFVVKPGIPYEIELLPANKRARSVSYYFPSFNYSDPLVYLRGIPEATSIAAMLGRIPGDEQQSVLVIYSAASAMIAGRDSVAVNGIPISSSTLTPAAKTIITSFVFDDGDRQTSGSALRQFASAPFIGGVDLFLPAAKKQFHTIYFNGSRLTVPAAASKDRILLAVFR